MRTLLLSTLIIVSLALPIHADEKPFLSSESYTDCEVDVHPIAVNKLLINITYKAAKLKSYALWTREEQRIYTITICSEKDTAGKVSFSCNLHDFYYRYQYPQDKTFKDPSDKLLNGNGDTDFSTLHWYYNSALDCETHNIDGHLIDIDVNKTSSGLVDTVKKYGANVKYFKDIAKIVNAFHIAYNLEPYVLNRYPIGEHDLFFNIMKLPVDKYTAPMDLSTKTQETKDSNTKKQSQAKQQAK